VGLGDYTNPIVNFQITALAEADSFIVAWSNGLSGTFQGNYNPWGTGGIGAFNTTVLMSAPNGADFQYSATFSNDEAAGVMAGSYESEDGFVRVRVAGTGALMDFGCTATNNGYTFGKGGYGGHAVSLKGQTVEYEQAVADHGNLANPYAYSYMGIFTSGQATVENAYYKLGGMNFRDDSPAKTGRLTAGSRWTATGTGQFVQQAWGSNYLEYNGVVMPSGGYTADASGAPAPHVTVFYGGFNFVGPTPKEPGPSVEGY